MQTGWRNQIETELQSNILPFWSEKTIDAENGGFYGALSNTLEVDNQAPRTAVLTARILWTFAAAYRRYGSPIYLQTARRADDYLRCFFLDPQYGGVYWSVDRQGRPLETRKQVYAQAFAIYGMAEFYRATGEGRALSLAQELFSLVEKHSFDPVHGGNLEALSREWQPLEDMRLSPRDVNSPKSMNTLLHLMEAYTNLLKVWPDSELRRKQRGLVEVFLDRIIDPAGHHLRLFFDQAWNWKIYPEVISFGHDIEASWLLVEAAQEQGDPVLLERCRNEAVSIAAAVCEQGRYIDGSLFYETGGHGPEGEQKHWWVQAEAVVGFYNAFQISGQPAFAAAAKQVWEYIEARFVDRAYGDWVKTLDRSGAPLPDRPKAGPWECPYHHSRACYEMLDRLE